MDNKILTLKSNEASDAFIAAYRQNRARSIMECACKILDAKYAPQRVFKAKYFASLDKDMPVTYSSYIKVDDTATFIANQIADGIGDETLLEYIEKVIDTRMQDLPTCDEEVGRIEQAYSPIQFRR